jgi:PAS domain S-box-containing protein
MLQDLINEAAYMAHGYCLLWKPWLIALHAASDVLIFGAYFAIPSAIWIFLRKRTDLSAELRPLALLFAGFIFLCGLTHAVQLITLWWPVYETQGYVKAVTALVSATTAVAIFPLIPKAVAIPSPRQLQSANDGLALEIAAHRETLAALQKAKDELEMRVTERTRELEHSKARFEALVRASAQTVWTCNADGQVEEDSPSWRAFSGRSYDEIKGEGWLDAVHPDDRARVSAAWQEAVHTLQTYSIELRLRHSSGWRWTAAKAVPLVKANGGVREWVGMNIDIDGRKRSEDHAQFILRELSHRTKNLLAVVDAMARQTAKSGDNPSFAEDFSARLQGLARSHDLLISSNWIGGPLEDHVRSQLGPFAPLDDRRVSISGPRLMLRPAAVQALGLAFHELATNASKYGALAQANGRICVEWDIETGGGMNTFMLSWLEHGLSAASNASRRRGFGYTVLMRVVPDSLSGEANYTFDDQGVRWRIKAPLDEVRSSVDSTDGSSVTGG